MEDATWQSLDPPQRRQQMLEAVARALLRQSQVQPLLLVFEDLHWIDAETQAVLDRLMDSLPAARLLVLVTYRPEYQHGWGHKTYDTQLRLDPLPSDHAEELLHALLGIDPSLRALTQQLIARTKGNPFFLEESVRSLMDQGILVRHRVGRAGVQSAPTTVPLTAAHLPATVQAVLAARIDRLPPDVKGLLQTAAVIGTEVPFPLLEAIAELPEDALFQRLSQLQSAEFLYETHLFPEPEYTFKHALTHEVAYGSLLQERRRALHGRIVDAMERRYADRLLEQVERLAHHALRGEVWAKAVVYCRQAGAKAVARSATREAAAYFDQALAALPHLPDSRDTCEQAVDLRFDLRLALLPLGEYGRTFDALREAEALAKALEDQRREGWIAAFLVEYYWRTGEPDRAIASGQHALALAKVSGDVASQVMVTYYLGRGCWGLGDYGRAMDLLGKTVAALDGDLVRERFGNPFPVCVGALAYLARCMAERGDFAQAMTRGAEAVRIAEAVDQPLSIVVASFGLGSLCLFSESCRLAGRLEDASTLAGQALALARTYQEWGHEAYALRLLCELAAASDSPQDAEAYYRHAVTLADELGMRPLQAHCHRGLGTLYAKTGQHEQARAELDTAIDLYRAMDMTFWLPKAETALAQVGGR